MKYLAIDFETANDDRGSACSLALVKVKNGNIVNYESYLIKPPSSYFKFTYLHGITWNDVKYAPSFRELWPQISHLFSGIDYIVAHNVSFDKSVLETCCYNSSITPPSVKYECTVKISRSVWGIKPTKLSDVCRYHKIPLNHHQAASDALACATIMLKAANTHDRHINFKFIPSVKSNHAQLKQNNIEEGRKANIKANYASDSIDHNVTYKNVESFSQETNPSHKSGIELFDIIKGILGVILFYLFLKLIGCDFKTRRHYNQHYYPNKSELVTTTLYLTKIT